MAAVPARDAEPCNTCGDVDCRIAGTTWTRHAGAWGTVTCSKCRRRGCAHCCAQHLKRKQHDDIIRLQAEVHELRQSLESAEDRHMCVVCLERPRVVMLRPCNHVCLCLQCSDSFGHGVMHVTCPICDTQIDGKMDVHVP